MVRYWVMSRLGLVEPLVRWQRSIELGRPVETTRDRRASATPRLAVRPR
jgi:hypothetical protein